MKTWKSRKSRKSRKSYSEFSCFPVFDFAVQPKSRDLQILEKKIPRFPRFLSFGPGCFGHRNDIEKKYVEATWIFHPAKLHEKSTWKQRKFFDQRNYIENVSGNGV